MKEVSPEDLQPVAQLPTTPALALGGVAVTAIRLINNMDISSADPQ